MFSIKSVLLLLAAAVADAANVIEINNACASNVYFEAYQNAPGPGQNGKLISSGVLLPHNQLGGHAINYGENGLGIVVKASFRQNPSETGPVIQFEVDRDVAHNRINYDISTIDGDPFKPFGSSLYIPGCEKIHCPPGNDAGCRYPKDVTCFGVNHNTFGVFCDH